MSPSWWAGFPAAEASIRCGAGQHRLRWAEGRLIAADHPDAEGELVLAALGGDKAECVTMAEAWGAHCDDLDVLALGPRSAADPLTVTWESLEELRARSRPGRWIGGGPGPGRGPMLRAGGGSAGGAMPRRPPSWPGGEEIERAMARRQELLSLFALGPGFQQRLSGTVAAAWSPDGSRAADRASVRPALTAALAGRLAPAASSWLGIDADQVSASLREGSGWGDVQLDGTGQDARLDVSLPFGWLARVWAPGLAVLRDHLIVDVLEVTWPRARVRGLRRPGAEPVVLSARHDGEDWAVVRSER